MLVLEQSSKIIENGSVGFNCIPWPLLDKTAAHVGAERLGGMEMKSCV